MFFYAPECSDKACFDYNLEKCSRAIFISAENMTFQYKILGRVKDTCVVNVKLLDAELPRDDKEVLVGKDMRCSIPQGVVILPESSIQYCTGLLKEQLQERIITRLHEYIAQNINIINSGV